MFITEKFKEQRSLKNISSELNLSHTPIYRTIKSMSVGMSELLEVLCVDEFKGNSSGHKYHLSIVDGKK